ncbi:hypothetical protein [Tahibacter amnicola]|uniref:DUF3352 domain-containing protein n=1 Tax=Tahibacter amnicola TaxID=2976241 RepID=A0ABY6BHT6_9GAMM|nr:hypothetical protein [Tahibacter amnicola]UXI69354.1 hypothetical protein N4264_06815 [Tahibacter amnicola]
MSVSFRKILPLAVVLALSACGKKSDPSQPLAFVPADTPYVFANLEPMPQPVIDEWQKAMKEIWPLSFGMYERMLDRADTMPETERKAARAVLEEIKTHATAGTLNELGFKGSVRAAVYGVGLVPVARVELASAEALRATVARVEGKAGAKLPTAKIGDQEYWVFGSDKLVGIAAIMGNQLVVTIAPKEASEDLRKRLLGITPPEKSLDPSALEKINSANKYTSFSSGYMDVVRIVDLATSEAAGPHREFLTALGAPTAAIDATCRTEYLDIARKFPRLVAGYTEMAPKRMAVAMTLELEQTLAADLVKTVGSAPGTAAPSQGLFDMSIALPVLKHKEFWLKQAKAVTAKPYACKNLASLNTSFADMQQKLDTTIPPPLSDFLGARVTMSKFTMEPGKSPEGSGKILVSLSNPASALAMAQMSLPFLKDVKLATDGKPVEVPGATLPPNLQPVFAVANDKAVAVSVGPGENADLTAYLGAAPSTDAVFLRSSFNGSLYGQFGAMFDTLRGVMSNEQQQDLEDQKKLFDFYARWIKSVDFQFTARPNGIEFVETITTN